MTVQLATAPARRPDRTRDEPGGDGRGPTPVDGQVTVDELVARARDGEQAAWEELIERYSGLVWSVARRHGLADNDVRDVYQTTWMRLLEHLHRIRCPAAVGSWLATTAQRECWRLFRRGSREIPVEDTGADLPAPEPTANPDHHLLREERDAMVREAVDRLPDRCRRLLDLLMDGEQPSYREVSAALDMPMGSIGPTRGRCLDRLRARLREVEAPTTPEPAGRL